MSKTKKKRKRKNKRKGVFPLVFHPNDMLRRKCEPVDLEGRNATIKILDRMFMTMRFHKGYGLAAPQIGIPLRVFVMSVAGAKDRVMINPIITRRSEMLESREEGCLSIPGIVGDVLRHRDIEVKYLDMNFAEQKFAAIDIAARVIQHEIDHLDGKLFIDRCKTTRRVKK